MSTKNLDSTTSLPHFAAKTRKWLRSNKQLQLCGLAQKKPQKTSQLNYKQVTASTRVPMCNNQAIMAYNYSNKINFFILFKHEIDLNR